MSAGRLKNRLSEYVRLAAGGETVLVTDQDRVVAEIGPPSPTRTPVLSDALLVGRLSARLDHATDFDRARATST